MLLPASQTGNVNIKYHHALFTSASAFSDTGLVTVPTYKSWSLFGQAIIAILILCGGLGVFAIKIFIFNYVLRLQSGINERELVNTERGADSIGKIGQVIATSMMIMMIIITFSGLSFSLYFYFVDPVSSLANSLKNDPNSGYEFISAKGNWNLAFRYGFFHSISAANNAGFDIIGTHSLVPYYQNYGFQLFTMLLFIIGGIGYPVIYDLTRWFKRRIVLWKYHFDRKYRSILTSKTFEPIRLSLFTKVTTITYFIVGVLMISIAIALETSSRNPSSLWQASESIYGTRADRIFAIIFNMTATRSAGFTTIDLYNLTPATTMLAAFAMFIGASPSSTGGGIRTTTLAIVVLALWSKITRRPQVRVFKRSISQETVTMSFIVFMLSIFLVTINVLILTSSLKTHGGSINDDAISDPRAFSIPHLLFEVSSAFGTTGLTSGITSKLNIASQISLIFTMFIGQLGISSTILAWKSKRRRSYVFEYIEEGISIG